MICAPGPHPISTTTLSRTASSNRLPNTRRSRPRGLGFIGGIFDSNSSRGSNGAGGGGKHQRWRNRRSRRFNRSSSLGDADTPSSHSSGCPCAYGLNQVCSARRSGSHIVRRTLEITQGGLLAREAWWDFETGRHACLPPGLKLTTAAGARKERFRAHPPAKRRWPREYEDRS